MDANIVDLKKKLTLFPQDLSFVQTLLHRAVAEHYAQQENNSMAQQQGLHEQRCSMTAICQAALDIIKELSEAGGASAEDRGERDKASIPRVSEAEEQPVDISTPAVRDAGSYNLMSLHLQVADASERVQAIRQSVPAALLIHLSKQLESARPVLLTGNPECNSISTGPTSECERDGAEMGSTSSAEEKIASVPDEELLQLQQMLLIKLEALPSLRARMDQAEQRLSRVLGAVEVDQGRTPPHTVERALLNRRLGTPTPDDTITFSNPSDATRKRLAEALFAP